MGDAKQNTEGLIASLSDDLSEVKPMSHPIRRVVLWAVLTALYTLLMVALFVIRPDFSIKLHDPNYVFELMHIIAISISAMFCSSWLCVPDMRGQKWMLAVPTTLFAVFTLQIILRTTMEIHDVPRLYLHHCVTDSVVFGIIPLCMILFLSIKGKTTHPFAMSFMNALAVGSMGYFGLRVVCMSDEIGHLYAYHLLPYILFGFVISMVGRRIYRW